MTSQSEIERDKAVVDAFLSGRHRGPPYKLRAVSGLTRR